MPARGFITQLPEPVRQWLEAELLRRNFSGYLELTDELNAKLETEGQELSVSKTALYRFGSQFEERIAKIKQASMMAQTMAREIGTDDENTMNDALLKMVQQQLFDVLVQMQANPDKLSITAVGKVIAELSKASVGQKRYAAEVRERVSAAAETVDEIVKEAGISADTAGEIRAKILGIARTPNSGAGTA